MEVWSSGGILLSEVSFVYDVFDRRIAKTVDADGERPNTAETIFTVYNGDNAWADFDESQNVVARYLFGNSIDELLARSRPSEGTAWYLTDQLGSVRDILNSVGALINHIDYDSFGNIIAETNASAGDRFKFTSREWDAEIGLYYYRARFYDPATGRFMSQDPLGFGAGDANLYRYVGNSPLMYTDPLGLTAAVGTLVTDKFADHAKAISWGLMGGAWGFICVVWEAISTGKHVSEVPLGDAIRGFWIGFAIGFAAQKAGASAAAGAIFLGVGALLSSFTADNALEFAFDALCWFAAFDQYEFNKGVDDAIDNLKGKSKKLDRLFSRGRRSGGGGTNANPQNAPRSGKWNRPNVQDDTLNDVMDNLWRPQDKRPGGTIAELLREKASGGPLVHLEKAKGRLTQLIKRVNDHSNPLSKADRAAAERVINDLKDAIRIAEGR